MLEYLQSIKPILDELDQEIDILHPIIVEDHLLPLFVKHSRFKSITLYPTDASIIRGMHLSSTETDTVHIFYKRCIAHVGEDIEPSCPGCQMERFTVAKELVHTLDSDEQRTHPDQVADHLLDQLIKGDWLENDQVMADGTAGLWAIELLARYCHRIIATGNFGTLTPSSSLTNAKATGDYSYLARQYILPQDLVHMAFSDRYMSTMRDIRKSCGLRLICPA